MTRMQRLESQFTCSTQSSQPPTVSQCPPASGESTATAVCRKHEIPFEEGSTSGLIKFLINGGVVTESGTHVGNHPQYDRNKLWDGNEKTYFLSIDNATESWFSVGLTQARVLVTGYSLQGSSLGLSTRLGPPKSWKLEGTNNKSNRWEIIDQQSDCFGLLENGTCPVLSFRVSSVREYQFIRFTQLGRNQKGSSSLMLLAFGIFGQIIWD